MTHKSCKGFNNRFEVRGTFLDITEACDKFWKS